MQLKSAFLLRKLYKGWHAKTRSKFELVTIFWRKNLLQMKKFIWKIIAMKDNLYAITVISDGARQTSLTIKDAKVKAIRLLSTFRNVLQPKIDLQVVVQTYRSNTLALYWLVNLLVLFGKHTNTTSSIAETDIEFFTGGLYWHDLD